MKNRHAPGGQWPLATWRSLRSESVHLLISWGFSGMEGLLQEGDEGGEQSGSSQNLKQNCEEGCEHCDFHFY